MVHDDGKSASQFESAQLSAAAKRLARPQRTQVRLPFIYAIKAFLIKSESLSREDIHDLLTDQQYFTAFLLSLPSIRALDGQRDALLARNEEQTGRPSFSLSLVPTSADAVEQQPRTMP